jgi:hypothetical protein
LNFRESEVQNLGAAAGGDEDVGRLDVAVDDARGVSRIQSVEYFHGDGAQRLHIERTIADALLQRRSVQKLHGDEGAPVLLADVVDRADVRVVQRGGGARVAPEARPRARIRGELGGQELERDKPLEPRVLRPVDNSHPAAAELSHDAIVGHGPTDQVIGPGLCPRAPLRCA